MVSMVDERVAILAVVANLRPSNQLHVHDSDDISNHLHVYTFCYSLVQDIPITPAILRKV